MTTDNNQTTVETPAETTVTTPAPDKAADKPAAKPAKKQAAKKPKAKKPATAPREGTKLRKFFDKARTAKGVDAAASRAIYGYDGGLWITITQLATQFGLVGAKYQDGRKCSYRLLKPGQSTAKAKEVFKPGKAA